MEDLSTYTEPYSESRLSWLRDFDTSDTQLAGIVFLVRLIDPLLHFLDLLAFRHQVKVREYQLEVSTLAHENLARLRAARNRDHSDIRAATIELNRMLRDFNGGRWASYSPERVQIATNLAVDPLVEENVATIRAVQKMLAALQDAIHAMSDEKRREVDRFIAGAYHSTRRYSYFTQQVNLNILPRGSVAWRRTCNVTSLAMVLISLGIAPFDLAQDRHESVTRIYCSIEEVEFDQLSWEKLWNETVSQISMPDFLQLVAIDYFLEKQDKKQTGSDAVKIKKARALASNEVTSTAHIFESIASRFGVRRYPVCLFHFDSGQLRRPAYDYLFSTGNRTIEYIDRHNKAVRDCLAVILSHFWAMPNAPDIIASLVWFIGFRYKQESETLARDLSFSFGPVNKRLEGMIARLCKEPNWLPNDASEIRVLTAAMIRVAVAEHNQKASRALRLRVREHQREAILNEHSIDDVIDLADNLGLMAKGKYVEELWHQVANRFNCYANNELLAPLLSEVEALDLPKQFISAVSDIREEGLEVSRVLARFQSTTGQQLKEQAIRHIKPLLDVGAAIVVLRAGHYVALLDVNEKRLIVNDPAWVPGKGSKGKETEYTWERACQLRFFRAFHVFFHPANPPRGISLVD